MHFESGDGKSAMVLEIISWDGCLVRMMSVSNQLSSVLVGFCPDVERKKNECEGRM